MLLPLIALIVLLLAAWFWRSSMQGKELATLAARNICETHDLQLLDETVAIKSLKFRRDEMGSPALLRHYEFEYYDGDQTRKKSTIDLLCNVVVDMGLNRTGDSNDNVIRLH